MNRFWTVIKGELLHIFCSKVFWIVFAIVVFFQPLLAVLSANETVRIGLDASPATHPDLFQALPPLDYLGFYDIIPFGLPAMITLGAVTGSGEYKHHRLRTTFLCCSNRILVFITKLLAVLISSSFIAIVSIYVTIAATHTTLGHLGLHPIFLSSTAWSLVAHSIVLWVAATLIAFAIGTLGRNMILPLIFLIPQLYANSPYLVSKWQWPAYLPVTSGIQLLSTPSDPVTYEPVKGGIALGLWVLVLLLAAGSSFIRRDVGGIY